MGEICFNVNDYVFVRLKERGRKELKRQHDELDKVVGGTLGDYKSYTEDKDGWSKWQLHSLMNYFGHIMTIGFDPPFEPNIKFELDEGDI